MADNNTIARPYAHAAFDVAQASGSLADWSAALESARAVMADGQVAAYLATPALTDGKRLQFLTGLLAAVGSSSVFAGSDKKGSNFLRLLIEYGRVEVLPEIAVHFAALKAKVENTVDVTVTSAVAISESRKQLIATALQKRLGRSVRIETKIDENLIGGAVIRAGDVVIDGSLRSRLEGLTNALTA